MCELIPTLGASRLQNQSGFCGPLATSSTYEHLRSSVMGLMKSSLRWYRLTVIGVRRTRFNEPSGWRTSPSHFSASHRMTICCATSRSWRSVIAR